MFCGPHFSSKYWCTSARLGLDATLDLMDDRKILLENSVEILEPLENSAIVSSIRDGYGFL